jgi:hypothetical protein
MWGWTLSILRWKITLAEIGRKLGGVGVTTLSQDKRWLAVKKMGYFRAGAALDPTVRLANGTCI